LNDREIGKFNHSLAQSFNPVVALCVLRVLCELYEFGEFDGESSCLAREAVFATVCAVASYD